MKNVNEEQKAEKEQDDLTILLVLFGLAVLAAILLIAFSGGGAKMSGADVTAQIGKP